MQRRKAVAQRRTCPRCVLPAWRYKVRHLVAVAALACCYLTQTQNTVPPWWLTSKVGCARVTCCKLHLQHLLHARACCTPSRQLPHVAQQLQPASTSTVCACVCVQSRNVTDITPGIWTPSQSKSVGALCVSICVCMCVYLQVVVVPLHPVRYTRA
jgi:hypothetical protein